MGIVKSKTSGICSEGVLPGVFSWHWEFLLPTNATLVTFPTGERTVLKSVNGSLPDAALYSKAAGEDASYDFTYNIELEFTVLAAPDAIASLCGNGTITDEASLADYIEKKAQTAAEKIAASLMENHKANPTADANISFSLGTDEKKKALEDISGNSGIAFTDTRLVSVHLPDINLYETVRDQYFKALQEKKERKEAMQKAVNGLIQQFPELSAIGQVLDIDKTADGTKDATEEKVKNKTADNDEKNKSIQSGDMAKSIFAGKVLRAIRGATGVEEDNEENIKKCVLDMCSAIFKQNDLNTADVVSVLFTVTGDIHAMNPATALRKGSNNNMAENVNVSLVPLFCAQEPEITGMAERTIRVMVTAYMEENKAVSTVYINGTQNLRG